MKFKKIFLIIVVLLIITIFLFNHQTVYYTGMDPTNTYKVKVTYNTFLSFIPMMPGSSGDKSGYVEIFNKKLQSMGKIPIEMLQLAQVEWVENGARIPVRAEWDFTQGTCYYWNESGNNKIFTKKGR